ncbi:hypothetical protein CC1G_15145 [Coprinopsis cinerea okayama7|uniref:Uncharacterized protein n=1 Tax=Coprinopsis cinerea (strain Okayama-7 / 130 / ATCC MYA-4618 / FGSC 9003) TaxID=240176 RepID=D6RPP9_COPC7|nr:hypothetical protein CC1G_15145 [Coprinopsis cinerea okayama7\|eukprot:XP_002910506.1 hypothetical protein CC1G_15145 [Coprinopsis cinerea okayama7\
MEIKTFDISLRRRADFPDLDDLPRVTITEKTSLRQEFDYKFEKMSDFSLVHSPIWAKSDERTLPAVVVMDGEGNVRQLDGDGKDREVDDGSSWGWKFMRSDWTRRRTTTPRSAMRKDRELKPRGASSLLGHTYGAYANNHLFFFSGHAIPELPLAAALTAVPISRRGLDAGEPLSCYTFYVNLEGDFNPEMIDLCTICPLTGRMAVIWLEYGKEVEEIRVIDLLDLPVPGSEE